MRLLHVTPAFQHPQVRGPHRHYHFLRELAARHQLTLLTLVRSEVPENAWDEVAGLTERLVTFDVAPATSGLRRQVRAVPGIGRRLDDRERVWRAVRSMRRAYRELVADGYDGVLFHGKSVFPAVRGIPSPPLVVDFCDATAMRLEGRMHEARGPGRLLLWLRLRRMQRRETQLLTASPHVAFISPRDRAAVLGPGSQAAIVPNGVDLAYWTRNGHVPASERCLVFTGVMDYGPNDDAARYLLDEVVPRIRASRPDVTVLVVGRNPTPALLERSRQPGVTVTGFVDDMRPYLERATVFVAPVRHASGTQNKVLEAMAMALPVVTTPVVAEGLVLDDTPPPVTAVEGADGLAAAVLDLLAAPDKGAALGTAGHDYVAQRFSWPRSAQRLEQMLEAAIAEGQPVVGRPDRGGETR